MAKDLISVIVPIYNVEKYLRRCVDSILAQTYTNLEVILVDDGSSDGSPAICDEYAKKDKRVKVVHKKNAGVSAARNDGLALATGEYIVFVDSDDYIDKTMYEELFMAIKKNNADLVVCDVSIHFDNYTKTNKTEKSRLLEKKEENIDIFLSATDILMSAPCNKIFKKNLISKYFNINLSWGEDQVFVYNYITNCNRIYYLNKPLYHYITSNSQLSVRAYKNYIERSILLLNYRKQFLIENNFIGDKSLCVYYWLIVKSLFAGYYYESLFDKKNAKKNFENALQDNFVKEAIINFKPCGLTQKLVFFMVKHKQYVLIKLAFSFRKEKRNIRNK